MKFGVEPEIFEWFPGVKLGVAVGLGIDNSGQKQDIGQLLQKWQDERGKEFAGVDLASHERVRPWREAYSKFGAKPSKYNSSIEALLRRVSQGGSLPQINPIVDLYNALSLKHLLPFGAEDLDKIRGDIRLAVAKGDEKGKYIGGESEETCEPGEIAYVDDAGFICRRWNWREADRTKLTSRTKNFILVVEALPPAGEREVKEAIDDFVVWARQQLGGEYKTAVVDKNNLSFEFDLAPQKNSLRDYSGKAGEIQKLISHALKELDLPEVEFGVEHPGEEEHGDYSSNIALKFKNPRQVAEQIVSKIGKSEMVDKVEVAGPGFINFYVSEHYLWEEMKRVLDLKERYGSNQLRRGKKISVEYTDPNPFKELHIGHWYSNSIGEAIARMFEFSGAKVWRADFYGDVGLHVAKSIWGIRQKMQQEGVSLEELKQWPAQKRQQFLGQGYALGTNRFEEDEKVKEEIKELNKLIFVAGQEYLKKTKGWQPVTDYRKFIVGREEELAQIQPLYDAGLEWSLEYFETYYRILGTKFDGYYPESWVGEYGMQLVDKGLKKGVLVESEGAVIFPGDKYGLHTRVFVNKHGLPTYEAKDLGLAWAKYQDFKYDQSINIFGKEIDEYYKVVKEAMKLIEPELGAKSEHLAHGMVKLPEGKMSSRTGNVITVEWLLNELKGKVMKVMEEPDKATAEIVAVGAVKYALLKSGIGQDVVFDVDKSVSLQGNSGPYLQYTYARTQSVLRKANGKWQMANGKNHKLLAISYKLNSEELGILRYLYRFPEVVIIAGERYEPSQICTYLYELSQRFNTFYNKHTILGRAEEARNSKFEIRNFRLMLTAAVGQVVKNGLWLLGIQSPEKM